jgi:hypothetical protein
MVRGRKNPRQLTDSRLAELKLRLPEPLRADLEHAAARNKRSMNAEMVKRLSESFQETNKTQLIANALVKELDADVLAAMFEKILAEGILSESGRRQGAVEFAAVVNSLFGQRGGDEMRRARQANIAEIARLLISEVKADDVKGLLQELSELPSARRAWLPLPLTNRDEGKS